AQESHEMPMTSALFASATKSSLRYTIARSSRRDDATHQIATAGSNPVLSASKPDNLFSGRRGVANATSMATENRNSGEWAPREGYPAHIASSLRRSKASP